jgi:hypothetical protein
MFQAGERALLKGDPLHMVDGTHVYNGATVVLVALADPSLCPIQVPAWHIFPEDNPTFAFLATERALHKIPKPPAEELGSWELVPFANLIRAPKERIPIPLKELIR